MGGKRSTSFEKGNPGKPKGAKNVSTRIKEAIGIKNWEELTAFVENNGVERCVRELQKMKGASYVYAFLALTEYIKPKLQRSTVEATVKHKFSLDNIEDIPTEELIRQLDSRNQK